MLPKISLKKLIFLSLGVLIIGALTNCGGSGGGGGSGGAAPAAKKAPAKAACSDPLDIKVSINDADEECLLQANPILNFALKSIAAAEEKRTWDNSKVKVALLQISEDATATACTNVKANSVDKGWVLDFSSNDSCEITVSLKNDSNTQVVYTLKMVGYGISEAADFKSDFFAKEPEHFVLTKNIDLAAETGSFAPSFKGQLDGLDHTINGLSIGAGTGTADVGLISQVRLSAGDATVEIKNLTLGITKLVGQNHVGGLIGKVESGDGANAVQIEDVTVEFTDSAELKCTTSCGGLVGSAVTAVHFSGIKVTGAVSTSGSRIGGVVGDAGAMQLSSVKAHFNMNHSGVGEIIGLVVGYTGQNSILSKIDASGTITCEKGCTYIGGVVGILSQSQLSQVKSRLQLKSLSNTATVENVGGVVGQSPSSTITAVYGKLTAKVGGDAQDFGSIAGDITGSRATGSLKRAVGYLDVKSDGVLNKSGGLVGFVRATTNIQQVFAAGSMNAVRTSSVGQIIGLIEDGSLTADNCYSGAFTGNTIPDEAVGEMSASTSVSFTKCYTRATNFVKAEDLPEVTFETVYATTAQTGGKGSTQVEKLPETFDLSVFNDSDTLWTNEYDGNEYTYPMLAYPKEDMGPVSAADWFEFQTQANEKK